MSDNAKLPNSNDSLKNSQSTASTVQPTPETPTSGEDNFYIFGDASADRDRMVAQQRLFGTFIQGNAHRYVPGPINTVLDLGCGEGRLSLALKRVYPSARITAIDKDAQAIERAKQIQERTPAILKKIDFVAGDIEQNFPKGPFDLIYVSLVLMHLNDPKKVLRQCYDALNPGGTIWIKETHPDLAKGSPNPIWQELMSHFAATMAKMGRNFYIGGDVPLMLQETGFAPVKQVKELYSFNNNTVEGRITIGVSLGALYNGIKMISRTLVIPEEKLLESHKQLAQNADKMSGQMILLNVIGQRPK